MAHGLQSTGSEVTAQGLPDLQIEPMSPALAYELFTTEPQREAHLITLRSFFLSLSGYHSSQGLP